MICKSCNHQNPSGANFCSSCGAALTPPEDVTAAIAAIDVGDLVEDLDLPAQLEELEPGNAMLLVKKGSNVGSTYLLDSDVVGVGRQPTNNVFLDDVTVSRNHAEFRRRDGRYVLKDAGSLNGTYVNGERVDNTILERGDEIQVGKFKLVFLTGADHH